MRAKMSGIASIKGDSSWYQKGCDRRQRQKRADSFAQEISPKELGVTRNLSARRAFID
jgi:hypothetical protein